jgi:hypothetical protein
MIELWDMSALTQTNGMIDFGKYMLAEHPEIPLGLNTLPCLPPKFNISNLLYFWTNSGQGGTYDPVNDPVPSLEESLIRSRKYLGVLRDGVRQGGTSPFINMMVEPTEWINEYPPLGISATENDWITGPTSSPTLGQWRKLQDIWIRDSELLAPYPNPTKTTSLRLGIQ